MCMQTELPFYSGGLQKNRFLPTQMFPSQNKKFISKLRI